MGRRIATPILEALGDNRLLIDPVAHTLVYRTITGEIVNARTGEKVSGVNAAALKKVRVNNSLRSAIDAALGSLTLANPDPAKRVAAAEAVFKSRDPKALAAVASGAGKRDKFARRGSVARSARGDIGAGSHGFDYRSHGSGGNSEVSRRSGRAGAP